MSTWPSTTIPLLGANVTGGVGGTAQFASGLTGKQYTYTQKFQVNLATVGTVYNTLYPTGFTYAAGDSLYLMQLPAFTQVNSLQVFNYTAISTAPTSFSVGDTGSGTRYVSAFTTFTVNTVWTQAVTTNPLHFYAANDKLLLLMTGGTAPYVGTIQFVINMTDSTADAPTGNQ